MFEVFYPIIGSRAVAIYGFLTSRAYGDDPNFTCSRRGLAAATGLDHATVSRELAILKEVGLILLEPGGGNRSSKEQLVDLTQLAVHYGVVRQNGLGHADCQNRYRNASSVTSQTWDGSYKGSHQAATPRRGLSGKPAPPILRKVLFCLFQERDTGVSAAIRERSPGETQQASHLFQEEIRKENIMQLDPADLWKIGHKDKGHYDSDENELGQQLYRARCCFGGAIDALKKQLVNPGRFTHRTDCYSAGSDCVPVR
jgi:hypothetical protein